MACFIIIHQQILYLLWRRGPGGLRAESEGEDKIIIATHFFHSNTFHYHLSLKNPQALLSPHSIYVPLPCWATDCSVVNIWGLGDVDAAAAFLHLISSLEQNRRKWTIQTDKCVPFRVKAKHNVAAHLFWGITNKALVQFFQGVSSGTTRFPVSNPYLKCSIWRNQNFANVFLKVLSHPFK